MTRGLKKIDPDSDPHPDSEKKLRKSQNSRTFDKWPLTVTNVLCAGNGKEALNLLEKYSMGAIISDIMMDEMDGYELLEEVRKSEKLREIPFVFITTRTGTSEEIKGLTYGAVEYIQKPFSMETLKARIDALITFNQLKRRAFELEKYHSVGMITASICHEIINPLSGIEGPLYVIEKNAGKDEKKLTEGINHIKGTSKYSVFKRGRARIRCARRTKEANPL